MTMERMPCLPFGRTESGSFSSSVSLKSARSAPLTVPKTPSSVSTIKRAARPSGYGCAASMAAYFLMYA